jgi:hypothetical protein
MRRDSGTCECVEQGAETVLVRSHRTSTGKTLFGLATTVAA